MRISNCPSFPVGIIVKIIYLLNICQCGLRQTDSDCEVYCGNWEQRFREIELIFILVEYEIPIWSEFCFVMPAIFFSEVHSQLSHGELEIFYSSVAKCWCWCWCWCRAPTTLTKLSIPFGKEDSPLGVLRSPKAYEECPLQVK